MCDLVLAIVGDARLGLLKRRVRAAGRETHDFRVAEPAKGSVGIRRFEGAQIQTFSLHRTVHTCQCSRTLLSVIFRQSVPSASFIVPCISSPRTSNAKVA